MRMVGSVASRTVPVEPIKDILTELDHVGEKWVCRVGVVVMHGMCHAPSWRHGPVLV